MGSKFFDDENDYIPDIIVEVDGPAKFRISYPKKKQKSVSRLIKNLIIPTFCFLVLLFILPYIPKTDGFRTPMIVVLLMFWAAMIIVTINLSENNFAFVVPLVFGFVSLGITCGTFSFEEIWAYLFSASKNAIDKKIG